MNNVDIAYCSSYDPSKPYRFCVFLRIHKVMFPLVIWSIDCSLPIEYCSFNTKKIYKQCLVALARSHPLKADALAPSLTAPMVELRKCGISRLNGVYRRQSPSRPFEYIHSKSSDLCIVRMDVIAELHLDRVWVIVERSRTSSDFLIHHYLNVSHSLFPPLKAWQCIAGIRPFPTMKHVKAPKVAPLVRSQSAEEVAARSHLESLWRRYPKIHDISDTEWLAELKSNGLMEHDVEWVATEKVHGANMSMMTDGKCVCAAKRTSLLFEDDTFYKGWQEVMERHRQSVLCCFEQIKKGDHGDVAAIIVYGELFGGNKSGFGAEDVLNGDGKKYSQIQCGISYSPKHHFYPFDIQCIASNGNTHWIPWEEMAEMLKCSGFEVYVTATMEGDLQCILDAFDPEQFEMTIPHKLKLSRPSMNNLAEGVVLRTKGADRVCIKYKAGRFGEIQKVRRKGPLRRSLSLPTSLDELERALVERLEGQKDVVHLIHQCINRNRMDCVLSKMGPVDQVDRNKMIGAFTADVWSDLFRIKRDEMELIEAPQRVLLKQFVVECIRHFVKDT